MGNFISYDSPNLWIVGIVCASIVLFIWLVKLFRSMIGITSISIGLVNNTVCKRDNYQGF